MADTCSRCGEAVDVAILACPACGSPRGVFATLQRALAALTLTGFVALWFLQTPLSGGQSDATALIAPGVAPGTAFFVVIGAILLAVFGSLVVFGPRLVAGARRSLKPPKAPWPGRLLFAQFLIAWVMAMVLEALVVSLSMAPVELVVTDGAQPIAFGIGADGVSFVGSGAGGLKTLALRARVWDTPAGARRVDRVHVAALSSASLSARLTWRMGSGELTLSDVAAVGSAGLVVYVAGKPVDGERTRIDPGDSLRVGDFEGTLRGPDWTGLVRAVAAGKTVALGLLLLGCLGVGGRKLFAELGVTGDDARANAGRGVVALLAFVPCYVVLVIVTQVVGVSLGVPVDSHPLVQAIVEQNSGELAFLVVLQAVVLAPILEEVLFRGFLLSAGARALGRPAGLVLSALAFAFVHAGFASLLPMFGLGLLFGLLRLASPNGSLMGPIAAHGLFNGLSLTLLFAAST